MAKPGSTKSAQLKRIENTRRQVRAFQESPRAILSGALILTAATIFALTAALTGSFLYVLLVLIYLGIFLLNLGTRPSAYSKRIHALLLDRALRRLSPTTKRLPPWLNSFLGKTFPPLADPDTSASLLLFNVLPQRLQETPLLSKAASPHVTIIETIGCCTTGSALSHMPNVISSLDRLTLHPSSAEAFVLIALRANNALNPNRISLNSTQLERVVKDASYLALTIGPDPLTLDLAASLAPSLLSTIEPDNLVLDPQVIYNELVDLTKTLTASTVHPAKKSTY